MQKSIPVFIFKHNYFLCLIILMALLAFNKKGNAQNTRPSVSKVSQWVIPLTPDYEASVNEAEIDDGYFYLLSDNQYQAELKADYYHYALKIFSDAGVQNASQITIDFNPAYQKLLLHQIQVIRKGVHSDRLDLSKIKTLQRETSLERNIYDGSYSAVLILDDVRKGDVIEYSYTIIGKNPVFEDKLTTNFYLGFSVPLVKLYNRILIPSSRHLNIKKLNTTVDPVIITKNGLSDYKWEIDHPKPVLLEDYTPKWFDPYGFVSVSEYNSWEEVKNWAKTLFTTHADLSPALKEKIKLIEKEGKTDDEKILGVIRFVQNEVRYMGIEIGVYSHQPNTANKVFKQRFGDCKDKSQLLCVMLNSMGYDASPVLINTTEKESTKNYLPSPYFFNHCTVVLKLGGKNYWIDPTIAYQGGKLIDNDYPDYRYGLVVTDSSKGLTPIVYSGNGAIEATEVFDIPDMEMTSAINLTVTTIYSGGEADEIRYQLANNSKTSFQEQYKNFYARKYPKIAIKDSLQTIDDSISNKFTTKEFYTIKEFWIKDSLSKTGRVNGPFEALLIESYVVIPKSNNRKMPIDLRFPTTIRENIEVNLPEEWTIDGDSKSVDNDLMEFKFNSHYSFRKVKLSYSYHLKKDFVPSEKADDYFKAMNIVNDNVTYSIFYNQTPVETADTIEKNSSKFNSTLLAFILFYAVVVSYICFRIYLINGPPQLTEENTFSNQGTSIGGWLVLVGIGIVLRPFLFMSSILTSGYFDLSKLERLAQENPAWNFIYVYELIQVVTFFLFSILLVVLFFSKRTIFPKVFVIYLIASCILTTLHLLLVKVMLNRGEAEIANLVSLIVSMCIWIPYMLISERVKTTFVKLKL